MHVLFRLAANAASILASDTVNRATTFVLYALVARYLGAFEFGQMSLALSLFYLFQVTAVAGLKTLITREVAKDRDKTELYLVNGSLLVAASSLASIAVLGLFLWAMSYSADTTSVILLLSLGLLPYALSAVCEAVFQAWERMQYIAYANVTANIGRVGMAFLLMAQGHGLRSLVLLILLSYVAIAAMEWVLLARNVLTPRPRLDPSFVLGMARLSSTFLGIDVIIALMSNVNVLLLSKLAGETELGHYSAAVQMTVPVTLLFQGIALSIFPVMCRRFDPSFQDLGRISGYLMELLLAIALPAAVGLFFLADQALLLLYGERGFTAAAESLRIMVWNLVLAPLTIALGQVLYASLRERTTLRIVVIDTLAAILFGAILVSQMGVMGAALASLLTKVVDFLQHYLAVRRLLPIALGRVLWKPAAASACMALFLTQAPQLGSVLALLTGCLLYCAVLAALLLRSMGGVRRLKIRLADLRAVL